MIVDLAMQRALDRYHQTGIPGLTEEEKTLATVWYFESKVANSGFQSFFKSQPGELASYAPTAFRNVGADALAGIAERANGVFGAGGVPADKGRRTTFLDALSDDQRRVFDELEAQYAEYGQDLDDRVEAYLAQRPRAGKE